MNCTRRTNGRGNTQKTSLRESLWFNQLGSSYVNNVQTTGYEFCLHGRSKAYFETRIGLSGHICGTIPVKVDFLGCKITPTVHSLPRFAFRAAVRRKS
jgi:hypothetical protein